tara:strand:+ start:1080 stop:1454 length:375 start_codon:yes stop_codon:yes gene_type:complete
MEKMIDNIKESFSCINENKYIIGLTMIMLNIGARFIIDELDDDLRKLITNTYVRRVVIFCSFFMATKDLFTAITLTIVFVILINEVFAKELDELNDNEEKKGGSFNKNEIDKAINTLKSVQMNM